MLIAYTAKSTSPTGSLLFVSFRRKDSTNCRNPTASSTTIKDVAEGSKPKIEDVAKEKQEHLHATNKSKGSYNKVRRKSEFPLRKTAESTLASETYFADILGCKSSHILLLLLNAVKLTFVIVFLMFLYSEYVATTRG